MQKPFWKESKKYFESKLKLDFIEICKSASMIGIKYIVVPLVDNGSIENQTQEIKLI